MTREEDQSMAPTESMFRSEHPIFARRELLDIEHVPNEERIVGRDEQIRDVVSALNPGVNGHSPTNIVVYGKTGTGKSLVAKHVSESARRRAQSQGISLGTAYVDCSESNTETQASRTIARSMNLPEETDVTIPMQGVGTTYLYGRLWEILDELYDVAVIILDEIDKLGSDDILMQLSRAGESGKLSSCKVGIIAISNKISYKDQMNERVKSSLRERELIFPPYDANQLRQIMQERSDAFRDGVLTDDVIPLSAAFAAQEHGDARKALDILRNAGELAANQGDEMVTEKHVRDARERADVDRFRDLMSGQPPQAQLVILALASLHSESPEETPKIPTMDIYNRYQNLAEQNDSNVNSYQRVVDLLKEQSFLDILGHELRANGRAKGRTMVFYLLEDVDVVYSALNDDLVQIVE